MLNKFLKKTAILLFWLAVWQVLALIIDFELIFPTPISTFKALVVLAEKPEFYHAVFSSLYRILLGFLLGVLVGFAGAVASFKFKTVSEVFSPVLKILKAVPVASFIILAFYWLKSDKVPILICFLMVLPMIWLSVETALKNIDKSYLELAQVYRLGSFKTFFNIKVPFIMPNFLSTMLTALGFAWKSGVAAEIICIPPDSLGGMIQSSKSVLLTPEVFALTVVVILLSIILESVVKALVRRITDDKT